MKMSELVKHLAKVRQFVKKNIGYCRLAVNGTY